MPKPAKSNVRDANARSRYTQKEIEENLRLEKQLLILALIPTPRPTFEQNSEPTHTDGSNNTTNTYSFDMPGGNTRKGITLAEAFLLL
jgi:hypothetical protein